MTRCLSRTAATLKTGGFAAALTLAFLSIATAGAGAADSCTSQALDYRTRTVTLTTVPTSQVLIQRYHASELRLFCADVIQAYDSTTTTCTASAAAAPLVMCARSIGSVFAASKCTSLTTLLTNPVQELTWGNLTAPAMEYDLMWDPSGMSASCFPRSIMFRYLVIVRDTHTPSVALMVILTIIAAIAFLGALLSILLYLRRRWLRLDSAGATTLGGPKGAFLGPTMNVRGIEAHEFATHTKTVFLPVHEGESAEYGAANAFGMHGIAMGDGARSLAVAQDPSLARRAIADIPLPVPGDGIDGYDGAKGRRHFVDVYGEANPNGDTSTGSLRRRRGEPESRADARRRAMLIARGEDPDAWMVGPDGVLVRRTGSASRRGAGGAASASAGGPGVRRTGAANRGFGSGAPPGSRAAQRLQSASVFPSHAGLRAGGDYALHEVEVGARSRSGSARGDRNGAGGPGDADAMGSPLGPDGRPRVAVRFVPQWVLGSFGRGGAIPDIGDGEDPERVGTRPHNDIIMLPEPYATTAGSAGSPMSAGSREAIEREDGVAYSAPGTPRTRGIVDPATAAARQAELQQRRPRGIGPSAGVADDAGDGSGAPGGRRVRFTPDGVPIDDDETFGLSTQGGASGGATPRGTPRAGGGSAVGSQSGPTRRGAGSAAGTPSRGGAVAGLNRRRDSSGGPGDAFARGRAEGATTHMTLTPRAAKGGGARGGSGATTPRGAAAAAAAAAEQRALQQEAERRNTANLATAPPLLQCKDCKTLLTDDAPAFCFVTGNKHR